MNIEYRPSVTSTNVQITDSEDFNYLTDSVTFNSKHSSSDSYLKNIATFDDYLGLNDIELNNENNQVILDGETQIRFLGNIRVWQLAATFLIACVFLS